MIEIADPEKFIELFFSSNDSAYEIKLENNRTLSDGAIEINFTIAQAPRYLKDLISFEEEEVNIEDFEIENFDSDNQSCELFKINIPKLTQVTMERINLKTDDSVSIVIYGDCSAGEYCDDENDAYLSGTLIACSQESSFEHHKKEADVFLCKSINIVSKNIIKKAIYQLKMLKKYNGEITNDTIEQIINLNRLSVS